MLFDSLLDASLLTDLSILDDMIAILNNSKKDLSDTQNSNAVQHGKTDRDTDNFDYDREDSEDDENLLDIVFIPEEDYLKKNFNPKIQGAKNVINYNGGTINAYYNNENHVIMPDISKVQVVKKGGKSSVIVVTFADDTKEKAVLNPEDKFNLEYGISICITKKLLSEVSDGQGSSLFNKIHNHAMSIYYADKELQNKQRREAEERKARVSRLARKKAAKAEKRRQKTREEEIEIQKEAILRAIKETGVLNRNG